VRIAELDSNRLDLSGNADKAKLTKAKKSSFSDQSVQDASTGSLQEAFKKFRVRRLQRKVGAAVVSFAGCCCKPSCSLQTCAMCWLQQELTGAEAVLSLPRTDPARKAFLRARFLELARSFIGRWLPLSQCLQDCQQNGSNPLASIAPQVVSQHTTHSKQHQMQRPSIPRCRACQFTWPNCKPHQPSIRLALPHSLHPWDTSSMEYWCTHQLISSKRRIVCHCRCALRKEVSCPS
jgi:hypothetical protein